MSSILLERPKSVAAVALGKVGGRNGGRRSHMDLRGGFMLEPEFVRGGRADQS
jgi:hypothetical protein